VPEEVKRERNHLLLEIQNQISEEDNQAFLGREVTVLVEGPSKTSRKRAGDGVGSSQGDGHGEVLQLTGRTACDRITVFDGNPRLIGRFIPVMVYDANAYTLFASVVTRHVGPEVYSLV
jgi:tRNA-2-methylthio-N6-dimethylallyladenosine synthase